MFYNEVYLLRVNVTQFYQQFHIFAPSVDGNGNWMFKRVGEWEWVYICASGSNNWTCQLWLSGLLFLVDGHPAVATLMRV